MFLAFVIMQASNAHQPVELRTGKEVLLALPPMMDAYRAVAHSKLLRLRLKVAQQEIKPEVPPWEALR